MASSISAGTTSSTALVATADTTGALQLATNNGTVAVTIDASQNVGIGTASPSLKLQVSATQGTQAITSTTAAQASFLLLNNTADSSNSYVYVPNKQIGIVQADTSANSVVYFSTQNTERMRIDSSGNLLVNNGAVYFTSAQYRSNVASSQLQFINNSAGVSLAVNGTSWGSLSDERDKEIIEPITDAVTKVSTLRSVIGRYKVDDADKRRAFLIAQDVKAVLPEAVTELEDEQQTLILQYTEVIPLLVAAIQEQQALITQQAAAIEALTTRITALEGTPA